MREKEKGSHGFKSLVLALRERNYGKIAGVCFTLLQILLHMVIMCWFSCELNKSVAVGVDDAAVVDDVLHYIHLRFFFCSFFFCPLLLSEVEKMPMMQNGEYYTCNDLLFVCFLFFYLCTFVGRCAAYIVLVMKLLVWYKLMYLRRKCIWVSGCFHYSLLITYSISSRILHLI